MIRQNPYRHRTPPGWNNITAAPRDGTVIEIQNNWGIAPTYGLYKWAQGRGWVDAADDCRGVGDGDHLSWRKHGGSVDGYRDPTGGAQDTQEYWDRAIIQATGGLLDPARERAAKRKPERGLESAIPALESVPLPLLFLLLGVMGLVFALATLALISIFTS